jgi:hypothetical protein
MDIGDEVNFLNEVRKNYMLSLKGLKYAEIELERLQIHATAKGLGEIFDKAIETAESDLDLANSMMPDIRSLNHGIKDLSSEMRLSILAYFPSPTENYKSTNEDLFDSIGIAETDLVVCDVVGDSMIGAGIKSSDLLLANSFEVPESGKIVIAEIEGKLFVKRYAVIGGVVHLFSENPNYEPIIINSEQKFRIKGVVKHILSKI